MKYRVTPVDPIIARDARQFRAGSPMHSMSWISGTVIAGAVRTVLWKASDEPDSRETLSALKEVAAKGGFPVHGGKIFLPRPLDIIKSGDSVYQIKPEDMPKDSGANMPLSGLVPAMPDSTDDFKPDKLDSFWDKDLMMHWLVHGKDGFKLNEAQTLSAPLQDDRVHASIDPSAGRAKDRMLFSTIGLDFVHKDKDGNISQDSISIDVDAENLPEKFTAPLGGERRLAEFVMAHNDEALWSCPAEISGKIDGRFRLILATPAVFSQGWLPDWIDSGTLTGIIPGTSATVRLISAVTDRWLPVSGWSYEHNRHKPMRRAVPAGSVYFFETIDSEIDAKSIWLKSVCTSKENINDGFGLVILGKC